MAYGFYFVVFLYLGNTWAFLDPCTFYPTGFLPPNETEVVIPTPSCLKGVIDWNYPRGSLQINFNQQEAFNLCIKDWAGGNALTIFDNSFGKETPFKPLTYDDEQCIRSNGHTAVLDVRAPRGQRYMAGFSFEIKI